MKVSEISFLNSQLSPHADDSLLQEISSKLAKCRSVADVGGHVELHPPVRGIAVAAYHTAEVKEFQLKYLKFLKF